MNIYRYVGNGVTGCADPLGLRVCASFSLSSGDLTVADLETGETATAKAFSGNVHANDPAYANRVGEDTCPLPLDNYDILNHPSGGGKVRGKDWYDLDKSDGTRDDYDPVSGWGHFRLHEGTASDGCITVIDDRSDLNYHGNTNANKTPGSPNSKNWDKINNILKNTSKSTVADSQGRSRDYYGNMQVTR